MAQGRGHGRDFFNGQKQTQSVFGLFLFELYLTPALSLDHLNNVLENGRLIEGALLVLDKVSDHALIF